MKRLLLYIKLWWMMSRNSFLAIFYQKTALLIFLFGKLIRFGFFVMFLYFLLSGSETLAGYTFEQTLFFFLTFTLVDVVAQFLFREVYRFRPKIVSGEFDLVLTKPISALFRSLLGGADMIDLITIPPLLVAIYLVAVQISTNPANIVLYIVLVLNGLLIATAFHIAVLAFGVITLEVDHTMFIYRDMVALGKFPIGIYRQPLRGILTYIIPIALMVTIPAQAIMGIASIQFVVISFVIGAILMFASVRFWRYALTKYTSASS